MTKEEAMEILNTALRELNKWLEHTGDANARPYLIQTLEALSILSTETPTSMHWQEMMPDTVFVEDASYLLKIKGSEYGCFVGYYAKEKFRNDHSDDRLPPEFFSHYAKITEPWKKPQPL